MKTKNSNGEEDQNQEDINDELNNERKLDNDVEGGLAGMGGYIDDEKEYIKINLSNMKKKRIMAYFGFYVAICLGLGIIIDFFLMSIKYSLFIQKGYYSFDGLSMFAIAFLSTLIIGEIIIREGELYYPFLRLWAQIIFSLSVIILSVLLLLKYFGMGDFLVNVDFIVTGHILEDNIYLFVLMIISGGLLLVSTLKPLFGSGYAPYYFKRGLLYDINSSSITGPTALRSWSSPNNNKKKNENKDGDNEPGKKRLFGTFGKVKEIIGIWEYLARKYAEMIGLYGYSNYKIIPDGEDNNNSKGGNMGTGLKKSESNSIDNRVVKRSLIISLAFLTISGLILYISDLLGMVYLIYSALIIGIIAFIPAIYTLAEGLRFIKSIINVRQKITEEWNKKVEKVEGTEEAEIMTINPQDLSALLRNQIRNELNEWGLSELVPIGKGNNTNELSTSGRSNSNKEESYATENSNTLPVNGKKSSQISEYPVSIKRKYKDYLNIMPPNYTTMISYILGGVISLFYLYQIFTLNLQDFLSVGVFLIYIILIYLFNIIEARANKPKSEMDLTANRIYRFNIDYTIRLLGFTLLVVLLMMINTLLFYENSDFKNIAGIFAIVIIIAGVSGLIIMKYSTYVKIYLRIFIALFLTLFNIFLIDRALNNDLTQQLYLTQQPYIGSYMHQALHIVLTGVILGVLFSALFDFAAEYQFRYDKLYYLELIEYNYLKELSSGNMRGEEIIIDPKRQYGKSPKMNYNIGLYSMVLILIAFLVGIIAGRDMKISGPHTSNYAKQIENILNINGVLFLVVFTLIIIYFTALLGHYIKAQKGQKR
ncbi:MAG: hypothetical protein ACTSVC_05285 [Promethearchaeota archaeon]